VCDDFIRAIDCDNIVVAVFLDFKRAFETIDRREASSMFDANREAFCGGSRP